MGHTGWRDSAGLTAERMLLSNSRLALADNLSLAALVGRRGLGILTHLQAPRAIAQKVFETGQLLHS